MLFNLKKYAHALKTKSKITQLEKVRFIKVDELKLIQVEFFSFFHFSGIAANGIDLFYMVCLENIERCLGHCNLSFQISNIIYM